MSREIEVLIQNHQGTFILDMLNEFRKDVIRCIFRDMVVPADGNQSDASMEHAKRLKDLLVSENPELWQSRFEIWYEDACPESHQRVYRTLHKLAEDFVVRFPTGSCSKAEVWAYLYGEEFTRSLGITQDPGAVAETSLAGLFNIVAFSLFSNEKRVKLIQPFDIQISNLDRTLRVCFPLATDETLRSLVNDFEERGFEHLELAESFDATPPLFRGNTAVCYDTGYYIHLEERHRSLLPLVRRVYNTSFLQFRPFSSKTPVGFIQLQCSLPGLIKAIVPPCSAKGRKAVRLNDEKVLVEEICVNEEGVVIVEFADLANLTHNWWEEDSTRVLGTLRRIEAMTSGWSRRLYNVLELSREHTLKLAEELRRRDQQKYRQQLDLLQGPLRAMMDAVTTFQRSSQEVRSVLYDPSESILGAHHLVSDYFEDGRVVEVWNGCRVPIMHQPNYSDCKSAQAILASILLRCLGKEGEVSRRTADHFFLDSELVFRACAKSGDAFEHDSKMLLTAIRSSKLKINGVSEFIKTDSLVGLNEALCRLKLVLFTPFKLDESGLNPLPIYLCASSRYAELPPLMEIDGNLVEADNISADHTLGIAGTAFIPKDILGFIIAVRREAENRYKGGKQDPRFVQKVITKVSNEGANAEISLLFDKPIIESGPGISQLRERVADILNRDQAWQIDVENFGNFSLPFLRLATRLLSRGSRWKADTSDASSIIALKEVAGNGRFKVQAESNQITLMKTS